MYPLSDWDDIPPAFGIISDSPTKQTSHLGYLDDFLWGIIEAHHINSIVTFDVRCTLANISASVKKMMQSLLNVQKNSGKRLKQRCLIKMGLVSSEYWLMHCNKKWRHLLVWFGRWWSQNLVPSTHLNLTSLGVLAVSKCALSTLTEHLLRVSYSPGINLIPGHQNVSHLRPVCG
jgi:hypothetical protein